MNTMRVSVTEKCRRRAPDLFMIALLFMFAFFVNHKMRISGLYMDDLYTWSCYGEQSFAEFVFAKGSSRFRCVYWFAAWLELALIGPHLGAIVPLNIILNALLAAGIYGFCFRLSRSRGMGFLSGILFLVSRFAYYQIGQLLGLMETMGIAFALAMCWYLYLYIRNEAGRKAFYLALLFYFLNCFTHERYMVLLPMLYYALIVRRPKDVKLWAAPIAAFGLMLFFRWQFIGTLSPAGTGGTNVADTIGTISIPKNLAVEIAYMLGFNFGPEHLNGLPFKASPFWIKLLLLFGMAALFFLCTTFIGAFTERRRYGLPVWHLLRDLIFFAGFLIGCAVSSAVTIRVEMRWVYVMYVFMLLILNCMNGLGEEARIRRNSDGTEKARFRISDRFPVILFAVFTLLTIPAQFFYRGYYDRIYLFLNQERYNSLADETYGKYGDRIFGKEIVIIGNMFEMSEFTAQTFFKTFDPERDGRGTRVKHVDTVTDFGQVTDRMLVLKEEPQNNCFSDVTDLVRTLKLGVVEGYYRDGWMDQQAEITVMTGKEGGIGLHLMYPGDLSGKEIIRVKKDGGQTYEIPLRENITDVTIPAEPSDIVDLEFTMNFWLPDASEQRGKYPMALLVDVTTD